MTDKSYKMCTFYPEKHPPRQCFCQGYGRVPNNKEAEPGGGYTISLQRTTETATEKAMTKTKTSRSTMVI